MKSHLKNNLDVFTEEFKLTMEKFQDNRKFNLLHKNDIGEFQDLRSNYEGYNFSCLYDQDLIEIYYNPERIKQKYLNIPGMTREKIIQIFKFLSHQEYGHTLFSVSSKALQNFTETENQIKDSFKNFNYSGMERAFRDFYADFIAKKIDSEIPVHYLEVYLKGLETSDLSYYKPMFLVTSKNYDKTIKNDILLYDYLMNTMTFFIFDQWNLLKPPFQQHNLNSMLKFFYLIFINFQNISETHGKITLIQTRNKLIVLVKFLDKFQYDNLIYSNTLDTKLEKGLRNIFDL